MSTRKNTQVTSKRSKLTPAILIIAVLLIGYTLTARLTHLWPFERVPSSSQLETTRHQTTHPSPKNPDLPSKTTVTAPATGSQTSNQVPVNPSFSASITQLQEASGQISFEAVVRNSPSAGTCVVTFSNPNDRPVTQQFNATDNANTATCGPISINANEFSYLGTWQVDFHYYLGNQQATTQSQITIR